ncbi:MAG TPA: DUF4234 domain-containing protein [Candidatus Flavonifractor merdigallinarum]|uniref:DUF4234 domain-containing protein n=1 Tax=Candidatus Flavonifractor merdigallinarum TaxID=2838589 RepID=A0A9D1Y728_9FIRM|nr:DUF4234 domain-containing protein [Candidatus Flavonifractor merdigallinarum]
MKQRSIPVCIILSLITCGIYFLYWFVCITDDTTRISTKYNTSGGMALVLTLITCGLYGFFWAYKMGECMDELRMKSGEPMGNLPIIYLILNLFGLSIITAALIQSDLNKYDFAA